MPCLPGDFLRRNGGSTHKILHFSRLSTCPPHTSPLFLSLQHFTHVVHPRPSNSFSLSSLRHLTLAPLTPINVAHPHLSHTSFSTSSLSHLTLVPPIPHPRSSHTSPSPSFKPHLSLDSPSASPATLTLRVLPRPDTPWQSLTLAAPTRPPARHPTRPPHVIITHKVMKLARWSPARFVYIT